MEFEKTLFRVHEKFLSSDTAKKTIPVCFSVCSVLGYIKKLPCLILIFIALMITSLFIYANTYYKDHSHCLNLAIKSYLNGSNHSSIVEAMKADYISYIQIVTLNQSEIDKRALNRTPINETEVYQIFEFSTSLQVMSMNATMRREHNFTEQNFTMSINCYAESLIWRMLTVQFFDLETILINEIIFAFKGLDCFMKNKITGELWTWTKTQIAGYEHSSIVSWIFDRLFGLIKLTFGYFLCSNITALYTKITIICAPIFILLTYSCCSNISDPDFSAQLSVYRAFPWIGIYLYAMFLNGQRKQAHMIFAFMCLIVIFYCLYLSSIFIWSAILFYKSIPKGLDENFYGFVAFLEFATLILVRTRSTIKWLPRISFILVLCFLYYVQFTPYGFFSMALYLLITSVCALFAYHLVTFEIPALEWNPFHHYTPSVDSPRTLFFPAFSLSWYHDLPQIWTMFYPLFGRSRFTQAQLAMVDRNTMLMQQTLDQAFQRGQNLHQDGAEEPLNNAGNNAPHANNQADNLASPISSANRDNAGQGGLPLNSSEAGIMIEINELSSSNQQGQQDQQAELNS